MNSFPRRPVHASSGADSMAAGSASVLEEHVSGDRARPSAQFAATTMVPFIPASQCPGIRQPYMAARFHAADHRERMGGLQAARACVCRIPADAPNVGANGAGSPQRRGCILPQSIGMPSP